jgi:hypothetical protein
MTTYAIDLEAPAFMGIPSNSFVQGTITTDCSPCIVGVSDIVDWNLSVAVIGQPTAYLSPGDSFVTFNSNNFGNLAAAPTGLYYDFITYSGSQLTFENPTHLGGVVQLSWKTMSWDIIDAGNGVNIITHDDFIGSAVPEPATWFLLLLGFAFVALASRSPRRCARTA